MAKIRKRISPYVLSGYGSKPMLSALQYIETGDATALGAIKKSRDWEYWRTHLVDAMDPPWSCDDEDWRAVHVLAKSGGYPDIAGWLAKGLEREKPDEDFHALLAGILKAGGMTDRDVAAFTTAHVLKFANGGSPNSAGRFVLDLDDRQLVESVKSRDSFRASYSMGPHVFLSLVGFFLASSPERLGPIAPLLLEPEYLHPAICSLMLE